MERKYERGSQHLDPAAVEDLEARKKALPGQLFALTMAAIFAFLAWHAFKTYQFAALAALNGYTLALLHVNQERKALERKIQDERTRALIRAAQEDLASRIAGLSSTP